MQKVTPFLMFQNNDAEEAMTFYTSLIEDASIKEIARYDEKGPGKPGSVIQAVFTLKGQDFMCIDSHVKHAFDFTPSFSIYLTCDSELEINRLYYTLAEGGQALMPLDNYGFSKCFGWVHDKFGVSWQLTFPH
ncbi:VOC family protein [Shouchella miscanthi]|uniref:VOC family protein n=1 Tax=Shouchella miscanthi TaxID=2598861 RepID=A0ABU6NPK3_9BACI|nr:VOC family protein [Shouchella miscanthi]